MDFSSINSLLSSVGFPIIMCLIMVKQNEATRSEHREEVKELTRVVESNTIAIQRITDTLLEK